VEILGKVPAGFRTPTKIVLAWTAKEIQEMAKKLADYEKLKESGKKYGTLVSKRLERAAEVARN